MVLRVAGLHTSLFFTLWCFQLLNDASRVVLSCPLHISWGDTCLCTARNTEHLTAFCAPHKIFPYKPHPRLACPKLALNSWHSWGWPRTLDPPASTSGGLGLTTRARPEVCQWSDVTSPSKVILNQSCPWDILEHILCYKLLSVFWNVMSSFNCPCKWRWFTFNTEASLKQNPGSLVPSASVQHPAVPSIRCLPHWHGQSFLNILFFFINCRIKHKYRKSTQKKPMTYWGIVRKAGTCQQC